MGSVLGGAIGGVASGAAKLAAARIQYKIAKENRKLQREIWETQKKWSSWYQDLWYNEYRPLELAFIKEVSARLPYAPKYDLAQNRAALSVRREFRSARKKIQDCVDIRCVGYFCATNKELALAEAKAVTGAVEKGYRAEEARKDVKDAQRDELIFSMLQHGRGLQVGSLNALNAAAITNSNSGDINPYKGVFTALGSFFGGNRQRKADANVTAWLGSAESNYKNQVGNFGSKVSSGAQAASTGFAFDSANMSSSFFNFDLGQTTGALGDASGKSSSTPIPNMADSGQ